MRYILNSAVITIEGAYFYDIITVEEAKKWLKKGKFVSYIGYKETAEAIEILTGNKVAINRKNIEMQDGDEALIFRLKARVDDPAFKGMMSIEYIIRNCEIGKLRKLKKWF